MEVRPLVQQQQQQQQRHPLMHAPSLHHPQQQQQQQQHVPSLNHSSSSPDMSTARPPLQQQVQPPQILQHPPPLQQPHHGTAPRGAQPRDLMPPLIGQKRDISGIPHGIQQSSGAMEHKLFVGSVSKLASEKDIEEVFAPYGRVDDVYIMRDEQKQSKGCAFVKFPTREMAMAAINALNSVYKMPGCDQPMIVRFADPKRPRSGDTRVGGPGFGGPGFSPRSGLGPRPASFSGGPLGARGPYWRPVGGPGMGMPQGGTRPYGTPNASRGPSHEVLQPMSSISSGLRTLPSGPSGSISNPAQLQTGVQGQIGSSNVLLHASQQGLNQPPLQRQAQGYDQQQQQQAGQQPLPTNIQQQQGNHQSVIQPVQVPQQTYSQIQVPEQRSQQQSSYGLPPSAQIYLQPYAQLSSSQPQIQQQMTFSEQQAAPLLQTQQAAPMLQTQQVQLPTMQHRGFSYSVQQSSSIQQHQQQIQQQQLSQPLLQQQQQQQLLPVQPLSGQLQPLPGQIQQPLSQQQLQIQQQQQPQPTQQSVNQPLHSVQAAHQAYFQTNLQSAQAHASVQPSWSIPSQQQVANSAVVVASTPATATIAAPAVTCNWTEHVSPEGHKYYYNSVTGESRWEKPDEFVAYEQQQPQQPQQTSQQQYATSATTTQQSIQAFGYGQLQPANAILDSSRTAQQLAPALQMPSVQQALPSVQDWMWKMKPAGS